MTHPRRKVINVNPANHEVEFKTQGCLHIEVKTKRLIISSITRKDEKDYICLLADPNVMKKYAEGNPYDENKSQEFLKMWTDRWVNHNPYSGYAIFEKLSNKFIGIVSIRDSAPGECKAAYIFHHEVWGKGYGTETSHAIFNVLVPRLMLRGYIACGLPLKRIVATARQDNIASQKILLGANFKKENVVYEYGDWRNNFCLFAKQSKNKYHSFYEKRDEKAWHESLKNIEDTDVSVTAKEMADSSFGQRRKR